MKRAAIVCGLISLVAALSDPAFTQDSNCWDYGGGDGSIIGAVVTPGLAKNVVIHGNLAYVADGDSGLCVVDVSDPNNPQVIGVVDTPGTAYDVCIHGDFALVAGGTALSIVDISDIDQPEILGTVDCFFIAFGVAAVGNHAYVADISRWIKVIDISDPQNPVLTSSIEVPADAYDLSVSGDMLYVARGSEGFDYWAGGLLILDISAPGQPVIVGDVGSSDIYAGHGLCVSGNYAYMAGVDPYEGGSSFTIFEVARPSAPFIRSITDLPGGELNVAVSGGVAYVVTVGYNTNLHVVDVGDPVNPSLIGSLVMDDNVSGVAIAAPYVYLAAGQSGLNVAWIQCDDDVAVEYDPDETYPDEDLPNYGLRLAVHPNPFNPQTRITFALERDEWATVAVHDLTGRRVEVLSDGILTSGPHTLTWNGRDSQGRAMPSGTYIVRLETESGVEARKVMLLR